jgi:hypothetical protein
MVEEHILYVVYDAVDVNVLLLTGMMDEMPATTFSHFNIGSRQQIP